MKDTRIMRDCKCIILETIDMEKNGKSKGGNSEIKWLQDEK